MMGSNSRTDVSPSVGTGTPITEPASTGLWFPIAGLACWGQVAGTDHQHRTDSIGGGCYHHRLCTAQGPHPVRQLMRPDHRLPLVTPATFR